MRGLFSSLLYSLEVWGDVKQFGDKLIKIERKALKRCLSVKSETSNYLVDVELNKANIIANIKDRQQKLRKL